MGSPASFVDVSAGPAGWIGAAVREAGAFVRLSTLLPRDLGRLPLPRANDGDDVVVLVHGALASAGAWRPLRARLEGDGVHATAFTYGPTLGVAGVAEAIGSVVSVLPRGVRVHLVGHSLGGLAVRWFVQETEGDPRVVQTVSVAAPFAGARGARLLPGPPGRDMRAGSSVLERLVSSAPRTEVPHLSIFGTADTAVDSHTSFPAGERVVVPGAGHNALLFHDVVAGHVLERVRRSRPAATRQ